MTLKRLWDTTEKKMVFAKWPTWHDCQVWTDEEWSKLYIYDMAQWLEYTPSENNDGKVYWPQWKPVDWDDEVGFYDTNEPTDLYVWESGDEVSYSFKNGNTVLQSWKIKEGQTPEYTGDTPTKAATAQYTYTFDDWNPEVWPIYKKTTFKAQFDATVNKYTATIAVDPAAWGSVTSESVEADYGTAISAEWNVLTIGETTITATAETWYEFSSWGTLPETLTADVTITATFEATIIPVESISDLPSDVNWVAGSTYSYYFTYSPNNAEDVENQISIVSSNDSIATVSSTSSDNGYFYVNYYCASAWETTFTHYINWVLAGTTTVTIAERVPVQSISQPSSLTLSVQQWQTDTSITLDYLPTNANDFSDVSINSDDSTIAWAWANSIASWTMTLAIQWESEGTVDVHTVCWEDDYTIAVTVTAPL